MDQNINFSIIISYRNIPSNSSSEFSQLTSIRCESENSNEKDLKNHSYSTEISQNSAVITASGNFKCLLCPYIFKNLKGLKYHQSTHSTEKNFKCNQCKLTFETAQSLKFHVVKIHKKSPDEKPFECKICPSKFKQQRYLIKHQLTHVNTFDFECERCKQRYKTNASVKRHQRESCRGPKIR